MTMVLKPLEQIRQDRTRATLWEHHDRDLQAFSYLFFNQNGVRFTYRDKALDLVDRFA